MLISTPQFDRACELYERQLRWNAKQVKGRVKLQTLLPVELPEADLVAVARKMAPHADDASILRLVGFAQSSDDYLAGIERLMLRATFFANREGREIAGRADIKRALEEAAPRLEPVADAPAKAATRRLSGTRATRLQGGCKGDADTFPPAPVRLAGLDSPAADATGSGASGRLQSTEAANSD